MSFYKTVLKDARFKSLQDELGFVEAMGSVIAAKSDRWFELTKIQGDALKRTKFVLESDGDLSLDLISKVAKQAQINGKKGGRKPKRNRSETDSVRSNKPNINRSETEAKPIRLDSWESQVKQQVGENVTEAKPIRLENPTIYKNILHTDSIRIPDKLFSAGLELRENWNRSFSENPEFHVVTDKFRVRRDQVELDGNLVTDQFPLTYWNEVFTRASKSQFLMGKKPGANFRMRMSWVLKTGHFKIMDGEYDDNPEVRDPQEIELEKRQDEVARLIRGDNKNESGSADRDW